MPNKTHAKHLSTKLTKWKNKYFVLRWRCVFKVVRDHASRALLLLLYCAVSWPKRDCSWTFLIQQVAINTYWLKLLCATGIPLRSLTGIISNDKAEEYVFGIAHILLCYNDLVQESPYSDTALTLLLFTMISFSCPNTAIEDAISTHHKPHPLQNRRMMPCTCKRLDRCTHKIIKFLYNVFPPFLESPSNA